MEDNHSAPLLTKITTEEKKNIINGEQKRFSLYSSSFLYDVWIETKMIWYIAGPAILTSLFQYSLAFVTQTLVGHLGTIELAAVGIQNLVVAGIGFGVMLGMGSALETLCGQAFGAGKLRMLGIYMQRSWVILTVTALALTPVYVFATPILKLLGQSTEVSEMAGRFSAWMLPELFAFALNFPIQKFLQAQSKVMAMAWISLGVLVIHIVLSWLCIFELGMGLAGAAVTLNASWWALVLAQLVYVFYCCGDAWTGFSWLAFADLGGFVVLSLASAVMLCLEYWCFMVLILLAGLLKNPELQVDAATICMNVEGWLFMIPLGFFAASSVRVSNELGAGHPRAAKFSVWVMVAISVVIQSTFVIIILTTRKDFPALFTDDKRVMAEVSRLACYLAVSIFLCSVQPILSGLPLPLSLPGMVNRSLFLTGASNGLRCVAIGAGWQAVVAFVNIGSYYFVGLAMGCILGFKFNFGLEGLWSGVIAGIAVQSLILIVITLRTNWEKEVALANKRVSTWGRSTEDPSVECS